MGRHSGFVTAHATDLAKRKYPIKVDMVIIPEIEFDLEAICNRISQTPYPLTIVISEGIKIPEEMLPEGEGDKKNDEEEKIAGHHAKLANTCEKLMHILLKYSKMDIRTEIAGYRQRAGDLSSADTFLAEHFAELAVKKAVESEESTAIVFHERSFKAIPMKEMVRMNKPQNPDSDPDEIFRRKREMLLSDSVITSIKDQLSAAAKNGIID